MERMESVARKEDRKWVKNQVWNPDTCFVAEQDGNVAGVILVYKDNADGNAFWEKVGFKVRENLMYRDKLVREAER